MAAKVVDGKYRHRTVQMDTQCIGHSLHLPSTKKLTQMITGHGRFPQYFYRLQVAVTCRCFCGQDARSITHYIQDCTRTVVYVRGLHNGIRKALQPPHLLTVLNDCVAVKILTELVEFISKALQKCDRYPAPRAKRYFFPSDVLSFFFVLVQLAFVLCGVRGCNTT